MLLHWGTLAPQGASNLASVRFSGPVRIRAIRIHPKGALLFTQNSDAISETEPNAFSLSVFLTAQSTPTTQDPKPKGTNVLVPTTFSYTGGLREFPLDMGPEFVTRLMIVQGNYTRVTLAVYGDAISEPVATPVSYDPIPLPDITRHRLPPALDLCNSVDPVFLARELLAQDPDAPPLPLVIRLMCCLRAPDTHWDPPAFPYSNVDESINSELFGPDWLGEAVDTLVVPISPEVTAEALTKFADKVLGATSERTNNTLYMMARILRNASAQPAPVLSMLLNVLHISDHFDIHLVDEHIIDRLQDAAANPMMAHALRTTSVLDTLQSIRRSKAKPDTLKEAAARLSQRVVDWEPFEKALAAPVPDIGSVVRWIKEITSEDMTFGVFLLSMIEDESLASKLAEHTIQEQVALSTSLWTSIGLASLSQFVAFMRAFMGISCVVVVLCWSIHVSNVSCTERILALVRLWQEVDGYREIVNHLLLVPQSTYYLKCLLKNHAPSPPSATLIYVEQILACLLTQPETMARPELSDLVHGIPEPPASMTENELVEMVNISRLAEGGLPEAVGMLLNWSGLPVDIAGLRPLQVALLILDKALEDRETGELKVMQAAWQQDSHGLVYCLVEIFTQLVPPIRGQFLLTPPPPISPLTLLQLVASSEVILRILCRLLPAHPLPSRLTRDLTHNVVSLFIATDAVDFRYSEGSALCQAAGVTRPTCAETIVVLSSIPDELEPYRVGGELVLRTLLHVALHPEEDDPVTRLEQVFWLLDLVLPLSLSDANGNRSKQKFWTQKVLPNVLPELQRFMQALAVDHRVQLVKRFAELDRGEVGLGRWFVDEELKYLLTAVEELKVPQLDPDMCSISQARVANSIYFLSVLFETAPGGTPEFFQKTQTLEHISRVFSSLLDSEVTISGVADFACLLGPHAPLMEPYMKLDLTLTLLRGATARPSALSYAGTILPQIQSVDVQTMEVIRVASELGPTLQYVYQDEEWQSYWQQEEDSVVQAITSLLSWFVSQPKPETLLIPGISEEAFNALLEQVAAADPTKEKLTSDLRDKFTFSDDIVMRSSAISPGTLAFSTNRLRELLTTSPLIPSTPHLSGESIFKMATLSPITALVGTSRISTLTKTYQNNDFRQLSVRQNTSRRPSMHVDDFEQGNADPASPIAVHSSPPLPLITADYFQLLPSKPESE